MNSRTRDQESEKRTPSLTPEQDVALAYIGAVVPNEPEFQNAAFNPSGQMYQRELLRGLQVAGFAPSLILSVIPMPAYPKSSTLWVSGGEACLPEAQRVTLVPFLNVTPLKQIGIGIATLLRLSLWGWRARHAKARVVYTYNLTVPPGLFT